MAETGSMGWLVERLRALARCEHSDMSIGDEAADEIVTLVKERDNWRDVAMQNEAHAEAALAEAVEVVKVMRCFHCAITKEHARARAFVAQHAPEHKGGQE